MNHDDDETDFDDQNRLRGGTSLLCICRTGNHQLLPHLLQRQGKECFHAKDSFGRIPLTLAAGAGDCQSLEIIRILLENGADIEGRDDSGKTALFYAIQMKNIEMVRLLIESGADVKTKDHQGNTPLNEAIKISQPDIFFLFCPRRNFLLFLSHTNHLMPTNYALNLEEMIREISQFL